jgi:hypothetical protein
VTPEQVDDIGALGLGLGHPAGRLVLFAAADRSEPALRSLGDTRAQGSVMFSPADAEQVRDQLARMLLLDAPELADRLQQRWPLAAFRVRGW